MQLRASGNLAAAQKVLTLVKRKAKVIPSDVGHWWIEAYSNGREQGFCITGWRSDCATLSLSFSEARSSDSIVVYVGEGFEQGNVPSEDAYQNAKYFGFGEYEKAAAYVVKCMKKGRRA